MKKKMVLIAALIFCVALFCGQAAAEAEKTPRPKPTVRPLRFRYDYRLPSVKLTEENILEYFSIETGKEYSRGKKLTVPYTITPVDPAYSEYDGSTARVVIRAKISVFLNETDEEPFFVKNYAILLYREKGFQATGEIDVLLKLDQDEIWYTWEIDGVNGRVGPAEEEEFADGDETV